MVINEKAQRKIIPIAGGKGGVGKSVLTANLGVLLAAYGKRTVAVDLDLGGSNLHSYLGIKNTNIGIGNYLSDSRLMFRDTILDTPYDNLQFIPGDVLVTDMAELAPAQRKKVSEEVLELDTDYILLDIGSGSSSNALDFFLMSNAGIIVTTPQPPAILNAFNFLKNAFFRFVRRSFGDKRDLTAYFRTIVKDKRPGMTPHIETIVKDVGSIDRTAARRLQRHVALMRPAVVVNRAKTPGDALMGEGLRDLVKSHLGIELQSLGLIYDDPAVDDSARELLPLLVAQPDSIAARQMTRIAQKIFSSERYPEMPLALEEYADSFELTSMEAQNDYQEIASEGPAPEELVEMIQAQRKTIAELQDTLRRISVKHSDDFQV